MEKHKWALVTVVSLLVFAFACSDKSTEKDRDAGSDSAAGQFLDGVAGRGLVRGCLSRRGHLDARH